MYRKESGSSKIKENSRKHPKMKMISNLANPPNKLRIAETTFDLSYIKETYLKKYGSVF